jgi:hypothetical protein
MNGDFLYNIQLANIYIRYLCNNICMSAKKTISVSIENYQKLKRYGLAGDSLNSAISKLFKIADSAGGTVD